MVTGGAHLSEEEEQQCYGFCVFVATITIITAMIIIGVLIGLNY